MTNFSEKNLLKIIITVFLFVWLAFFLADKINLATADLGRHLKNGEIFLTQPENRQALLNSNFYSYTQPNAPFINHHWGSGVLFYTINRFFGFTGLSIFYILLMLATFYLIFSQTKKIVGFKITVFLSLLLIPLMASRAEIRPEVFSYFFAVLFFWILFKYKNQKIKFIWLYFLPVLGLFWINLHIYFFLGLFLIGLFWLDSLIIFIRKKTNWDQLKHLSSAFGLTIISSLFNPFGFKALLLPLTIFNNYGYRLVENQSLWFLQRLNFQNANFLFFKIALGVLILSFILVTWKNPKKIPLVNFILAFIISTMALLAIRNFSLFAFFALPITAFNLKLFFNQKLKIKTLALFFLSLAVIFISFFNYSYKFSPSSLNGFGLIPQINASANFFKKNNLQGPIFNNYDIGSYLIYHLYPQQKVFVDNRPEAYSEDFFQKTYIPMQESENFWQQQNELYNFNTIFFYLKDYTPWSQRFLLARAQDPNWAVVYADNFNIIFLKRNAQNQELIKKYEIPKERFNIKK